MEYMTKAEIHPWHSKFLDWIANIRKDIRLKGITFDCRLVGSAKRHMVIRHHNKGFDLDYQIIIHKNKQDLQANSLKQLFMDLLNLLVTLDDFKYCEDSTSSITIKMIDENQSKIKVGYDVVFLKNQMVDNSELSKILRHYKDEKPERWAFESLSDMTDAGKQFKKISGAQMWQDLRERYYKKKTISDGSRKSFQLLHAAVNETLKKFGVQ